MLKKLTTLAVLGLVCIAIGGVPRLNACPRSTTITYWGYIDNYDPSFTSCNYIVISPPWQATWGIVGEETTDCDGNYSTWGRTDCSFTVSHEQCSCAP
jgi:hypothetical protein